MTVLFCIKGIINTVLTKSIKDHRVKIAMMDITVSLAFTLAFVKSATATAILIRAINTRAHVL